MGNSKQASLLTEVHRDHLHAWNAIKKKKIFKYAKINKSGHKGSYGVQKKKVNVKSESAFFQSRHKVN